MHVNCCELILIQMSVLFSTMHMHVHVSVHVIFKISNDHEDLANQPLKQYLIFINDEKLEETLIFFS